MRKAFGVILHRELLEIFRDRRAVFFAVFLPALMWPGLLMFQGKLKEKGEQLAERTELAVEARFAGLPTWVGALQEELAKTHTALHIAPSRAPLEERLERLRTPHAEIHALLEELPPDAEGLARYGLYYLSTSEDSNQALRRLERALESVRSREREALFTRFAIPGDPAGWIAVEESSGRSEARVRAARFALWIPFVLVLVLLSGASFAALDAFAGERERGTLETLLVHPVRAEVITAGKYGAVLLIGWMCCLLNLASLLLSFQLGLLGSSSGALEFPGVMEWFWIALQVLLLSLLLTAILVTVCGRARSFREGQNYILPLTLVGALPAGLSALPAIPLSPLSALIPILGPSLAIREAFAGRPVGLSGAVAAIATAAAALWALRSVARTLDAERSLKEVVPDLEAERAGLPRRRAFYVAIAAFLIHAYGAQQVAMALGEVAALLFTLLIVLPIASLVLLRSSRIGARAAFPLADPRRTRTLLAGLLLVAGAPCLSILIGHLQLAIHPTGAELVRSGLEELPAAQLFVLVAVLPALSEELFFRGALLGAASRGGRHLGALLFTSFFFAIFHLSPLRFLPQFALGMVMAHARLRSGGLWIPIAIHLFHNGLLLTVGLCDPQGTLFQVLDWRLLAPMGAALLVGILLLEKAKRENREPVGAQGGRDG